MIKFIIVVVSYLQKKKKESRKQQVISDLHDRSSIRLKIIATILDQPYCNGTIHSKFESVPVTVLYVLYKYL